MQYMLLIYDDPAVWAAMPEEESNAYYAEYMAFSQALRDSGKFVAGDQLQPTSTATSIRIRKGETLTTDGPFTETKEVLGGYYLITADSLDEALEWGAKVPSSKVGTIEVRPIVEYPVETPA
jgi:hypothetical protein